MTAKALPAVPLAALLPSWTLSLAERNLSARTIEVYMRTGTQLVAWLDQQGLPGDVESISAPTLRAFLAAECERTSAISAHQHYRNLNVLFKWLIREGERNGPDPMDRVDPPKVTAKVKAVVPETDLVKLLKACEGTTFECRRDTAIIRVLIDTGVRVSGLANALLADVNLPQKTILIVLKGGDQHLIPIGKKATAALDRYIRARARHPRADSPFLWLGLAGTSTGKLGVAGVQHLLRRRCEQAGIAMVNPHAFRRTAAHSMLDAGMQEMDVARVAGWKGTEMVRHYAGELAAERARAAHARLSPGDRL